MLCVSNKLKCYCNHTKKVSTSYYVLYYYK